ncbi:hypothetical protein ACFU53_37265 [Streptomyces sp. NPDC057474]|uniref:hypothetical protein n=1 Tax=Streptomyces sp. NPDC057474 TaxID=3346144 RepID=UPI0036AE6CC3
MTAARDAEGQPTHPRLPAKLAAHPSVQAVLARRRTGGIARPSAVIDAEWLRELCLAAGADDAASVSLDHPIWPASASTYSPRCPAPAP